MKGYNVKICPFKISDLVFAISFDFHPQFAKRKLNHDRETLLVHEDMKTQKGKEEGPSND